MTKREFLADKIFSTSVRNGWFIDGNRRQFDRILTIVSEGANEHSSHGFSIDEEINMVSMVIYVASDYNFDSIRAAVSDLYAMCEVTDI